MIKVAAAFMAPQHKRAALQDKLAEYGIGLTKQAADLPEYMKVINPLTGLPNTAPAAKAGARLASNFAGKLAQAPTAGIAQVAPAAKALSVPQSSGNEQVGQGTAVDPKTSRLDALRAAFQKQVQDSLKQKAGAGLTGYAVGQYLRSKQPQAQTTAPTAQPAAQAPAGEQTPMIGRPIPDSAPSGTTPSAVVPNMKSKYPYAYERWMNTPDSIEGGNRTAMQNVRLFDQYLNRSLDGQNDIPSQKDVEAARGEQADDFARMITSPGTNQYNDAMQMLIQAGRNNQREFENTGKTKADTTENGGGGIPKNYTGPNRLNEEQIRQLQNFYPAMGATGNAQRFANWG